MENNPKVSIILRTHGEPLHLKEAIESILAQEFKDFELLIIDDGLGVIAKKNILQYARKDARIRFFSDGKKRGLSGALQQGVQEARGFYIAILDDDDFWSDTKKLVKQVQFLDANHEYALVGGGVIQVSTQGKEIARYMLPETDEQIRKAMLLYNPIANISVLFRKESWKKAGGYDTSLPYSEDWDLWARLARFGKMYNFQTYVAVYVRDPMERTSIQLRAIAKTNLQLRKKHREEFPNFLRGYILGLGLYVFSFLPFRKLLYPLFMLLRRVFF